MLITHPSFDVKVGESISLQAQGFDSGSNQGHAFVNPPVVWEIQPGSEGLVTIDENNPDHSLVTIHGQEIGTAALKVKVDGNEADVTINVTAPYDEILVTKVG